MTRQTLGAVDPFDLGRRRRRRRAVQMAVAGASLLLLTLAVALTSAVEYGHQQPISLPTPGGPFPVGRVVRTVAFPAATSTTTERVLWCWYPASPTAPARRADYLPSAWRVALQQHRGLIINRLANRDLALVRGHSLDSPAVAASPSPLPLVFLRAGLAALTADYTSLAEHLASSGYVVVGVDAPGRTALIVLSDNRVVARPPNEDPERLSGPARADAVEQLIETWTDDMVQLADGLARPTAWLPEFEGRINPTRVSIVGHSLGGATAAEFCRRDARCDLGVDIDGALGSRVVAEGLTRPFAFLLSDHGSVLDAGGQRIAMDIESVFEHLPPPSRWRATIRGANHFSFSDQMLVRNPAPVAVLQGLGLLAMDPRRGLQLSAEVVRRLLDARHSASGLRVSTDDIPELVQQ